MLALLTNWTGAYASSTPKQKPSREELCARAAAEVEASRQLIADLDARLATAKEQLEAERKAGALSAEEARLQAERVRLLLERIALIEQQRETAIKRADDLKADLERVRKERDEARRSRTVIALIAGGLGALLGAWAAGN